MQRYTCSKDLRRGHLRKCESLSFPFRVDFLHGFRVRLLIDIDAHHFGGHVSELHSQTSPDTMSCTCDLDDRS